MEIFSNQNSLSDIIEAFKLNNLQRDILNSEATIGIDGKRLSGGQRQRLKLASQIYYNRPMLILDEPTSALDIETSLKVIQNIIKIKDEKIIIIVSHDESIEPLADYILEVHNGKLLHKQDASE